MSRGSGGQEEVQEHLPDVTDSSYITARPSEMFSESRELNLLPLVHKVP